MVDSRSTSSISASSSFNFKSGDISGTAAKTSDEKMGQGSEYFAQEQSEQEEETQNQYTDRSAQLKATLNSLAMMNVANIINDNKKKQAKLFDWKKVLIPNKSGKNKNLEEYDD